MPPAARSPAFRSGIRGREVGGEDTLLRAKTSAAGSVARTSECIRQSTSRDTSTWFRGPCVGVCVCVCVCARERERVRE